MQSNDECNGVGDPIPLSQGDPGSQPTSQTQGTLLSGWSATQSHPLDHPDKSNNDSLAEYAKFSQSSGHLSTMANLGSTSVNPGTTSAGATTRPSANMTNRVDNKHQAATLTSSARSTNTAPATATAPSLATAPTPAATQGTAAALCAKAGQPQAALHTTLATFFNHEARAAREQESSMSQFYAVRLQEANSTIEDLEQTQLDLASKTSKNQDLRHRIDLMQLRMEMHHAQANGYGLQSMMHAPVYVHSNTNQTS
ncbi:uncharacterized protein PGTG_14307 [Puccinia graminis f. sp. tritici CRL 75-36-700-3]|uniref:Uncharacterized protein n=1 Tax=Puccinia graminis f. sp. tritici (strain CRL 75-36-700-3 / race SCCL) TaxID=418459 RepID=E3KVC8_PUCGT|nr:uncharacterized protein PGTG_14307 [Puccinia graminis f. sp. tritici CRL 75-36-700-3]EFP88223.1 hypothetical protein PGTG_14307 [Puccinia graminis f. sp. tritici CRL 75-36-700-3]